MVVRELSAESEGRIVNRKALGVMSGPEHEPGGEAADPAGQVVKPFGPEEKSAHLVVMAAGAQERADAPVLTEEVTGIESETDARPDRMVDAREAQETA